MNNQALQKMCNKSRLYLKRNSSTILTCIGAVGVVATAVAAVKATPKALRLLEMATDEKGEELTKIEVVKVAGPAYIPSLVIGASTIACIFGANALNKRQQAALMSAYALIDNSYKEYQAKVREVLGEEADSQVKNEIVKKYYNEDDISVMDDKQLFFDFFSMQYFESTIEDVLNAEARFNDNFVMSGHAYLNDFYEHLGISRVNYGYGLSWSTWAVRELTGQSQLGINHEKMIMDDGLECTIVSFAVDPVGDGYY